MPTADRLSTVASAVKALLDADTTLGLREVYYGDQEKIPATPSVCVEPSLLSRELAGIGGKGQTQNQFVVYVICYLAKIQDEQITRLASDQLAEAIMDVLHSSITMSGTVVHGFVTAVEYGYTRRTGALSRVARLTWTGMSKTAIA